MKIQQPVQSFPLPYLFPPGRAWAAIKNGVVVNMIFMAQQKKDVVPYTVFRQRSRARLAKDGVVWSGEVVTVSWNQSVFLPKFESTDSRIDK